MLYKPKFCCSCGEKIERADWTLFSSRRFCQLCETERKGPDYLVRAVVIGAVLFGAFGATGYLRNTAEVQPRPLRADPSAMYSQKQGAPPTKDSETTGLSNLGQAPTAQTRSTESGPEPARVLESTPSSAPIYYCGAPTKKGTPCSRRVKRKGYCWQHQGKAADPQAAP